LETPLRKLAPAVWVKMVRPAGIAPAFASFASRLTRPSGCLLQAVSRRLRRSAPDWRSGILLLNDDREKAAQVLLEIACAAYYRKEQTPLPRALKRRTRRISLADLSVFTGTPPTKPLVLKALAWNLFALNKRRVGRPAIDTPHLRS
jgi:hypothetical protein